MIDILVLSTTLLTSYGPSKCSTKTNFTPGFLTLRTRTEELNSFHGLHPLLLKERNVYGFVLQQKGIMIINYSNHFEHFGK